MISSLDLSYSDTLLCLHNRSRRLETATNLPFDLGEDFLVVVERMLYLMTLAAVTFFDHAFG
jgi:hypothetical protein